MRCGPGLDRGGEAAVVIQIGVDLGEGFAGYHPVVVGQIHHVDIISVNHIAGGVQGGEDADLVFDTAAAVDYSYVFHTFYMK